MSPKALYMYLSGSPACVEYLGLNVFKQDHTLVMVCRQSTQVCTQFCLMLSWTLWGYKIGSLHLWISGSLIKELTTVWELCMLCWCISLSCCKTYSRVKFVKIAMQNIINCIYLIFLKNQEHLFSCIQRRNILRRLLGIQEDI